MRGPGETSVESNSTAESKTISERRGPIFAQLQRDPCQSPPCKRLKQAQLSFTGPVSPETSKNGTTFIGSSSLPTNPCLAAPITKPSQSILDDHRTIAGAGGLVIGAPSPPGHSSITPNKHDVPQSPTQAQPITSHQLDSSDRSTDVMEVQPSSSQSSAPNKQTSPSQNIPKRPSSSTKSAEKQKRLEEKIRQRLEKQQLKQEKEKQLLEMRAIKEKERLQAKQKKEEERQEKKLEKEKKEKERLEKKQKEEQEKQERNKKREEEKRKKEEEKNAKLEAKRKREEEKKQQEEAELRKKQKAQQTGNIASFFSKKENASSPKVKPCSNSSRFQPFEIKQYMSLAPEYRKKLTTETKEVLEKGLLTQDNTMLYLQELRERKTLSGHSKMDSDVQKMKCEPVIDDENSNMSVEILEKKETHVVVKAKLFQFHTDNRPPYFGSWRKKSQLISPRNPFKQDTKMLDYEVDSDDEWEEEEPGESLSNSEGEDEDEAGDEEDKDGFFVPHGYLSDDEGIDSEDAKDKNSNPDIKKEQQLTKAKQWEAELKRKCKPLKPVCMGCLWLGDAEMNATLKQFEVCVLTDSLAIETTCAASTDRSYEPACDSSSAYGTKPMYVPEEAMPDLIKLLHGNAAGLAKLIDQFRRFWTAKCQKMENVADAEAEEKCQISKRQLERKIQTIATKERRGDRLRWYVHSHVLSSYGLETPLGVESPQEKENEGRVSPSNAASPGNTTILKFIKAGVPSQLTPRPSSKPVICSSTVIAKTPNVQLNEKTGPKVDASGNHVEIMQLIPSVASAEKEVKCSVSGTDQVLLANMQQMPSGNVTDNTPEPMEVEVNHCIGSTAETSGAKPLSVISKLNKDCIDHSVIMKPAEMMSKIHATSLDNKLSCSSHEVIMKPAQMLSEVHATSLETKQTCSSHEVIMKPAEMPSEVHATSLETKQSCSSHEVIMKPAEMPSEVHATSLETKQSCSSHEVIMKPAEIPSEVHATSLETKKTCSSHEVIMKPAEMSSEVHATSLETKQSCSSHEVICID